MIFTKKLGIASVALVVVVGTIAGLELSNTTHWFHKAPAMAITKAGNFSNSSQPVPNASANQKLPPKSSTNNTTRSIGTSTNTSGQTSTETNSNQWTTSASGNITVQEPVANALLTSGFTLAGIAKTSKISYTLIDNQVGLISRGTLPVMNGKFSGSVSFQSQAANGQLNVFSTDPTNGMQQNQVTIAVRF